MGFQDSPYLSTPSASASSNPGFVPAMGMAQESFQNGLKTLGSGMQELAEGIKQHKQNVQDQAAADTTFKMLVPQMSQSGVPIDPDVLSKFASSSLSQKKGMIGAMSMQYANALKTKQEQSQQNLQVAQAGYYQQHGDEMAAAQQEKQAQDQGMGVLMNQYAQVKQDNPDLDNNQALLKAFQGTQNMPLHPRVQAAIAQNLFGKFANQDAVNSEPKAFTGPNGETLFYQPGTKNPAMFSPYTKSSAQTDVVTARADARGNPGAVTPALQFKDLGNQIVALRKIPAKLRTPDENEALSGMLQKQAELTAPDGDSQPSTAPAASAPAGAFDSETAARSAGHKPGDVVRLHGIGTVRLR